MLDDSRDTVQAASAGNPAAVDTLLTRYLPSVRAFLRLRAGGLLLARESASDLAQSVCRDVLQSLDQFRYDGEDGFRRWLFKTAQRKIVDRYDYYKAQRRTPDRESPRLVTDTLAVYGDVPSPSHQLMAKEQLERLENAVEALPEDQREAFILCKVVGLTRRTVADDLNLSEGAVKMRLHRALITLAETMTEG